MIDRPDFGIAARYKYSNQDIRSNAVMQTLSSVLIFLEIPFLSRPIPLPLYLPIMLNKILPKIIPVAFACITLSLVSTHQGRATERSAGEDTKVRDLLASMTLEEKLGQLNQFSNPYLSTGTGEALENNQNYDEMLRKGQIGSFLNVLGAEETMRLQKIAVEQSRLGIPLIFGFDVVHGYKTIFPVPLGETASFDRSAMELGARIAAIESGANGLHWTFAPMVDISRDPRWGRIMEGSGEDVYVGEQAARARVKGFQGDDLAAPDTIAACAKHWLGYGAVMAGREYAMADVSERMIYEVYMPPFKAALDAGVATFMSSFNTNAGVPASGDRWLQTEVLKHKWKFDGFVVSDWTSINELVHHGIAGSMEEAAYLGFNAGVDMDMVGRLYLDYGKKLLDEKRITMAQIDDMVSRILRVKYRLGLFQKPYQYCDIKRQKELTMHPSHLKAAREVAKKSIVLMKNEKNALPITPRSKVIALIGPLAKDKDAPLGNWRGNADSNSAVSLYEGLKEAVGEQHTLLYAEGCKLVTNYPHDFFTPVEFNTTDRSGFAEAVATAKQADIVVMALGETGLMSGECRAYADISLKGLQAELLREVKKTGKPVVLALHTGRPLVLTDVVGEADAILNCWLLGSESGHAIAQVLLGKYNPSGKLPASFPYHVGQIPVFYQQLPAGRPNNPKPSAFGSKYRDIPNEPLFPFGFGLSYTTFVYKNLEISAPKIGMDDTLTIKATIANTGDYDGEEVVQLYIHDLVGNGVSRPVLELKGYEKVAVARGETKTVTFTLTPKDLAFYRLDHTFGPEVGEFEVFVGTASNNLPLKGKFELVDK
jgi:beta-glucosidase